MGTVHQLRPASVSVFGTARPDRPIAVQVASANAASSALLTVSEATAVHATLGQLIRDARLDGLLAEERADADRAVAELEHDAWASGAFDRALDRHLAQMSSAGGTQIQERESNKTSGDAFARTAGAAHDLAPALTGGGIEGDRVGHGGAVGMVPSRLPQTHSSDAEDSGSVAPRAGEEG